MWTRFVTDRRGRVVIAQPPNPPLLGWMLARGAAALTEGRASTLLGAAADGFLVLWGALELASGDSPFRRVLGAGALVYVAGKHLSGCGAR